VGTNCEIEASDNPGGVVFDGTYYMGGASYSVDDADDGASNGCSDNSSGSNQVYVHDTPNSAKCSNGCCAVIECQKWKDCAAIPGTYCTPAYSGADKAYCLPQHPGLREEAKTTQSSDKLLAIDMSASSVGQESPLFKLRESANEETIFEWQKLEQAAIGSHTVHSGLRCNTNSKNEATFSNMTCKDHGVAIAGADCSNKFFQAECCNASNECGKCLGTPKDGLTGALWPVTTDNGDPICETKERYSLNSLHNGAVLCDEDGDDWIRDDAYRAFMDTDMGVRSNAKCVLKVVEKWVLVNEYRQELRVSPINLSPQDPNTSSDVPAWICPDPSLPCLPLIETPFLDGENTSDTSGVSGSEPDRIGYNLSGGSTNQSYQPGDMNPVIKSCTSNLATTKSDYNKNGIQDWEENQDSVWSNTSFITVYNELQHYTFFEELYTGTLDGTEYRIEERPRCDLSGVTGVSGDWPNKIPLGYNDLPNTATGESAQWQSCMRAPGKVHANLKAKASGKVAVNTADLSEPGYDFSRFYWGTHSAKKYVEPVPISKTTATKNQIGLTRTTLAHPGGDRLGLNGGWCAVAQSHLGTYGAKNDHQAWKLRDNLKATLKTELNSLVGQKFEVDANGEMAPVGCGVCDWRGMNHYSQFQCTQVKSTGTGWTYNKLANNSTQGAPGYEYVLNECTTNPTCTETSRGDCLQCRRLELDANGNGTCAVSGSATCDEGVNDNENKVGFVSIRYGFEDRKAPTNNDDLASHGGIPEDLRGCVAEEMFDDVLCPTPAADFTAGIDGQKPKFVGFSLSPYGKLSCFKQEVCGDSYKDPSEHCDYEGNDRCIKSGEGACQCEEVDCTEVTRTKDFKMECNDGNPTFDAEQLSCGGATCVATVPDSDPSSGSAK